jgi:hypothetical protein
MVVVPHVIIDEGKDQSRAKICSLTLLPGALLRWVGNQDSSHHHLDLPNIEQIRPTPVVILTTIGRYLSTKLNTRWR